MMQPIRIRLRTVRRALREQNQEAEAEVPAPEGEVRITDGNNPERWARVRLVQEEYRGQRYSVIEVLEVAPNTTVAFVTGDVKV